MFHKHPFMALYFSFSSLMIFRPLCLLVSAALFTLTIWPFGAPRLRSRLLWRPHKELCFDWSAGLSTGVFLSIRANVRPPSSQWIPTKLTSNLLLLGSRLRFNPTPTFLGVTFDRTLSFSKHVSLLKAKFFPRLRALRCIFASSWGPSKESLSLRYKFFSVSSHLRFTRMVSLPKRYQCHQIGMPPPAAFRPPLSPFFSPRLLYLPYESP